MRYLSAVVLSLLLAACGGDSATGPQLGPPTITLVNGVTRPSGTVGSTVLVEGTNFGAAAQGKVLFTPVGGGAAIQAVIANPATDWSSTFILTTVPTGVSAASAITVVTSAGTSNAVQFALTSGAAFSPSTIHWSRTTDLPSALEGLGAVFMPASAPGGAGFVFVAGGADSAGQPTTGVYSAQVQSSGAIGAWSTSPPPLPDSLAYLTLAAASPYTAPIDTSVAGYLYAIGGALPTGQASASVWSARVAVDGTVGAWSPAPSLPAAIHSSGAVVFRGYLYVFGGANGANTATRSSWRAKVNADGSLSPWDTLPALPAPSAYLGVSSYGPFLYAAGGDSGTVLPTLGSTSGTETGAVYLARINMKDGTFTSNAWVPLSALGKARAKHSLLVSGGALLVSSGVYAGQAGSSENTYSTIATDGTISSWAGATGVNTIESVLGYSLYNEAAVAFADAAGNPHVLILGGANRALPNAPSAAVVYY